MNSKCFASVLLILTGLLFSVNSRAADITATGSGNWSSTNADAPWPDGIVPGPNDDIDVEAPFTVTVDTNEITQFIYGSGTVIMGAGVTLTVVGDSAGADGTQGIDLLDTSAPSNTVVYAGNAFWCKHQDYDNLVLGGTGNFYNGNIGTPGDNDVIMHIAGNLTVTNKVAVQQGDDFYIGGNLILGHGCKWDASSFVLSVGSNITVNGLLLDLDGALGMDTFSGNVTIATNGIWNLSDVTQWYVGGSLTNNGLIAGIGYGCITFTGAGTIAGGPLTIPTMTNDGVYAIEADITTTTNPPELNGTIIFDIAHPHEFINPSYVNVPLNYGGVLIVTNTGGTPASGSVFTFFNSASYGGAFSSVNYPILPDGLSWEDDTYGNGSIMVIGTGPVGSPVLSAALSGRTLTLSWDSSTYPGYSVQAQTNRTGLGSTWTATGSSTTSPFVVTINPTNPAVFFRLYSN